MKFDLASKPTMKWIVGASAAIAVMSLASTAGAATVLSTGVGNVGDPETNWTLTSPVGPSLTIVSGPAAYPPGTWVTAPVGSNWITPSAGGVGGAFATNTSVGEYDYSLSFANPGTSVSIDWSSDNGAKFFLNGNQLSTIGDTGYSTLTSFTILAGQFLGSNVFTVQVQNVACACDNPTGLLVSASFTGGAPTTTPLPAALPLFASGLSALGLLGWRKKRKAV